VCDLTARRARKETMLAAVRYGLRHGSAQSWTSGGPPGRCRSAYGGLLCDADSSWTARIAAPVRYRAIASPNLLTAAEGGGCTEAACVTRESAFQCRCG
jgi:hypothetical protein